MGDAVPAPRAKAGLALSLVVAASFFAALYVRESHSTNGSLWSTQGHVDHLLRPSKVVSNLPYVPIMQVPSTSTSTLPQPHLHTHARANNLPHLQPMQGLLARDLCQAILSLMAAMGGTWLALRLAHWYKAGASPLPIAMAAASGSTGRQSAAVVQSQTGQAARTKFDLNPPRGTRDFYPSDMRLRNWLFGHFRRVANEFGFEEYDAPVVENEELYIRKAGEEVSQQLYNFEDKGGRRLSLRPEMTPSLARMVLAKKGALPATLKWFSIPQCWRYERMTRGRRREHYQWNMDIWGVGGVEAEVELLAAVVKCLSDMGLTNKDVGIKINNRKLLTDLMASLSVPEEKFAATCVLIDKLEKVPLDALEADMKELGLSRETVNALLELIQDATLETLEARLGAESQGLQEIRRIYELAAGYGFADWLVFNASVVRGLAYYTGTVFEGFDQSGQLRAIFGGGRYDKLLETLGGESMPAVGFGFGDAVIVELLKMKNLLPDTDGSTVQVVIFPMDESLRCQAMSITSNLRAAGVHCDLILDTGKKTKWAFKYADRLAAKALVLVAPDEAVRGEVVLKNLGTGEQVTVKTADICDAVQKCLP